MRAARWLMAGVVLGFTLGVAVLVVAGRPEPVTYSSTCTLADGRIVQGGPLCPPLSR